MLVAAVASAMGILVDPRTITGAPAWLKPFKFAVAAAAYSLTLAWIFGWLTEWPRMRRVVGWTTAIVFVLEVAIIDVQAWRGTTSHFNVATPFDAAALASLAIWGLVTGLALGWIGLRSRKDLSGGLGEVTP